jgi:HSP20 family protein
LSLFRPDIDELFDRFFGDWGWPRFDWEEEVYPRLESHVEGNTLTVKADLPGIDPKEVELTVEGNRLTIKGERKATEEREKGAYRHREVRYGSFARTLTLPAEVEAEKIQARYEKGVLEVKVPLPAGLAAKKVPIEVEAEEPKKLAA